MTTSERVVEILVKEGGYRELPKPFKIGSLTFEFTAALVGTDKANDIVVVIDITGESGDDLTLRKVQALTRALDVLESRRSVTAVLTSGQPKPETVQAMSRVCRVLPVGAPIGQDSFGLIRDWLSVLLPLTPPQGVQEIIDWQRDIQALLEQETDDPLTSQLLNAAPLGKEAVENVLKENISAPVESAMTKALSDAR